VRLNVFDLRCVSVVSSACVAHDGHNVIGHDISPSKQQLNAGQTGLVEPGLPEPINSAVAARKLSATTDPREAEAVYKSGISVICAGKGAKSELGRSHVIRGFRPHRRRRRPEDARSHRGVPIDGDPQKRARSCFAYA
jgi:UDP-glucose 6-dehydrogenase